MKQKHGTVVSALPRLLPTLIVDKSTGGVLTWKEFATNSLSSVLDWVHSETQRLYDEDVAQVHGLAKGLKGSANSYARQNGYLAAHLSLPRAVRAKSRLAELVYHKLMSETAAYERNPNPRKQKHSFSRTVNLGAVDKQMCVLEREGHELILSWKCWDTEYEIRFTLPRYAQARNITKISLPVVSLKGFVFTHQEQPTQSQGNAVAGLDVGRVEPFTLAVISPKGALLAQHRTSRQLRSSNSKRERILREIATTRSRAKAREALGLLSDTQRDQVRALRAKASRMSATIGAQTGAEVSKILTRHEVRLLRVEDLSWAHGSKYGSKWTHSKWLNSITHANARQGVRTERVNPRGTSQHCHSCETLIVHQARTRTVWCGECSSRLDRDFNAALNIAKKKSYPIMKNRHDGGTCSEKSQGAGQQPNSLSLETFQTLEL